MMYFGFLTDRAFLIFGLIMEVLINLKNRIWGWYYYSISFDIQQSDYINKLPEIYTFGNKLYGGVLPRS